VTTAGATGKVCDGVWKHLVARHHDVNVEDRLCPKDWHSSAAHVFDTQDKLAMRTHVNSSDRGKLRRPLRIVKCENHLTAAPIGDLSIVARQFVEEYDRDDRNQLASRRVRQ